MNIVLEEGKYYRTRDGYCVGPLHFNRLNYRFPFYTFGSGEHWTYNGWFSLTETEHPRDLISEWEPKQSMSTETLSADMYDELAAQIRQKRQRISKAAMLDKAKEAVADRGLNYGKPEDNFLRIARLWNAHLVNTGLLNVSVLADDAKGVTPTDVALMMGLMKTARLSNQPAREDSWIDIAGYAACGAEIACKD